MSNVRPKITKDMLRRAPYRGIYSELASELGISVQHVIHTIWTRRDPRVLLALKNKIEKVDREMDALNSAIQPTLKERLRRWPYRGIYAELAAELGVTRQAVYIGVWILRSKRMLEPFKKKVEQISARLAKDQAKIDLDEFGF